MLLTFLKKKKEAEGIESFYFEPEKPVRYIAGQFIEIYLPHEPADDRGVKRWFTLSSSPHEAYASVTTRLEDSDGSTFKTCLARLKPGEKIKALRPMGDFVVPKDPSIPLIFVAVGIGITPFRSILKDLELTNDQRDVTLLYKPRNPETAAFLEEVKQLCDKTTVFYNKLSAERILKLAPVTDAHYIYLSGPESAVEKLADDIKKAGINERHVFTDFFLNYSED